MQDFARYLSRNEGSESPSNLVFVDTETWQTRNKDDPSAIHHTLRLWCAIRVRLEGGKVTRRITRQGKDHLSFWEFLSSISDEHRSTWVFAHNLGFDLTQLHFWEMLDNGCFTVKPLFRDRRNGDGTKQKSWTGKLCLEQCPSFVACRSGNATYKFIDTCNYWPKSLASIGGDIGTSKSEMPGIDRPDREWFAYCMQDCRVIEHAVIELIDRWRQEDCGVFQMTAASLSMTNFRHTCKVSTDDEKHVDIVCDPNAKQHIMERDSYFGGRISCFYQGEFEGKVYHLDVNSLYPHCMRVGMFPRRFSDYAYGITVDELRKRMQIYGVVATCRVNSQYDTYPVRVDGEQYHCNGGFWTTLAGPELSRAIDSGHIDKVYCAQFYSVAPLFREWVEYWYGRKLEAIDKGESGKAELEFVKLILNSLSGKWAQRSKVWKDQPNKIPLQRWGAWPEWDEETDSWQNYRGIGGHQQVLSDGGEPKHSFPLISSYIASYGREYMRKLINLCPTGSVLYMATDSLICTEEAYDTLQGEGFISDRDCGKLRVVGKHNTCSIYGPNWYALDGTETATGLRGKAIKAKNRGRKVEMFERLPGIVSRGAVHDVIVREMKVPVIHPRFRGVIQEDGYWTPYWINFEPEFVDRPHPLGYSFDDSSDTLADRIRPLSPSS